MRGEGCWGRSPITRAGASRGPRGLAVSNGARTIQLIRTARGMDYVRSPSRGCASITSSGEESSSAQRTLSTDRRSKEVRRMKLPILESLVSV